MGSAWFSELLLWSAVPEFVNVQWIMRVYFHRVYTGNVTCSVQRLPFLLPSQQLLLLLSHSESCINTNRFVKSPVHSKFYCLNAAFSIRSYLRSTDSNTPQIFWPFTPNHQTKELLKWVCMLYIPFWIACVCKAVWSTKSINLYINVMRNFV